MSTDVESQIAREPSAYRPCPHFAERFKDNYDDRNRHLDGEIVEGCIRRGEATKTGDGVYWLRETFGGVTYRLVVDVFDGEVITGYPIGINTEAARDSGRWSSQQIADIKRFIATDTRDQ